VLVSLMCWVCPAAASAGAVDEIQVLVAVNAKLILQQFAPCTSIGF